MEFEVTTGGYDVIKSGSIILQEMNCDLTFYIKVSSDFEFRLVVNFITDCSGNCDIYSTTDEKERLTTITCVNFTNQSGTGINEFVRIATIDGKKLFFQFWSYLMYGKSRKVDYTFLRER